MRNQVEEIKEKTDIVDFISQYVPLKKTGRNFKACCPFHQEKTPSFVVSQDRQIWRCFGTCGTGGDVISFLMKWENLSFYEALRDLAQRAGVTLTTGDYDDQEWKRKDLLSGINLRAMKFYEYLLHHPAFGERGRSYLAKRGTRDAIVKTFSLGYAPDSWDSLVKYLRKRGYADDDILATGLAIRSDRGSIYDRFRNRLMFPLKDHRGTVVGFSGRLLAEEKKEAKYVNTPETELYHKRSLLFGIDLAKDAIAKADNAIIVEGEFDMITPYQHGVDNVVAIKGAAFTEEQLHLLKRYTKRITLALDADEAGIEAMKRGIRIAERMEFDLFVVRFSEGKDPDEAATKNIVQFRNDVKTAIPVYDFLLEDATRRYPDGSSFSKKKIGEEMVPHIRWIENPIVQSHYVKLLASVLGVEEGSVYRMMRRSHRMQKTAHVSEKTEEQKLSRQERDQRFFLSYILQQDQLSDPILHALSIIEDAEWSNPSFAKIAQALKSYHEAHGSPFSYGLFVEKNPPELQSVADMLVMGMAVMGQEGADILKLAYTIKRHHITAEIQRILGSGDGSDESRVQELDAELRRIDGILRT